MVTLYTKVANSTTLIAVVRPDYSSLLAISKFNNSQFSSLSLFCLLWYNFRMLRALNAKG